MTNPTPDLDIDIDALPMPIGDILEYVFFPSLEDEDEGEDFDTFLERRAEERRKERQARATKSEEPKRKRKTKKKSATKSEQNETGTRERRRRVKADSSVKPVEDDQSPTEQGVGGRVSGVGVDSSLSPTSHTRGRGLTSGLTQDTNRKISQTSPLSTPEQEGQMWIIPASFPQQTDSSGTGKRERRKRLRKGDKPSEELAKELDQVPLGQGMGYGVSGVVSDPFLHPTPDPLHPERSGVGRGETRRQRRRLGDDSTEELGTGERPRRRKGDSSSLRARGRIKPKPIPNPIPDKQSEINNLAQEIAKNAAEKYLECIPPEIRSALSDGQIQFQQRELSIGIADTLKSQLSWALTNAWLEAKNSNTIR